MKVFLITRLLKKFPKGPKSRSSSFSFWFRLAEGAYREALTTFGLLLTVFSFFSSSIFLFWFLLFFLDPFLLVLSFLFLFLFFSSLFSFFFLIFPPIFTFLPGQFLHLSSLWDLGKYHDYFLAFFWPASDLYLILEQPAHGSEEGGQEGQLLVSSPNLSSSLCPPRGRGGQAGLEVTPGHSVLHFSLCLELNLSTAHRRQRESLSSSLNRFKVFSVLTLCSLAHKWLCYSLLLTTTKRESRDYDFFVKDISLSQD